MCMGTWARPPIHALRVHWLQKGADEQVVEPLVHSVVPTSGNSPVIDQRAF